MKLQQLRYVLEVYRHDLNVSDAADALFTSQPGVSKQIRLLEEEIGVQIFIRSGKRMVSVSPPGRAVLETAERIFRDIQNIKNIGREFAGSDEGTLTVAAVHDRARYALPAAVAEFAALYPKVRLNIRQGTPEEVAVMTADGGADFALTACPCREDAPLRRLHCGSWEYALLVPEGHELAGRPAVGAVDIVRYPLVTYGFAFEPDSGVERAFRRAGIAPEDADVRLLSADAEMLKGYVRAGLGIALLDRAAFDPVRDKGLVRVETGMLFDAVASMVLLRPDTYFRGYAYDFLRLLSPDLTKERVDGALYAPAAEDFSI